MWFRYKTLLNIEGKNAFIYTSKQPKTHDTMFGIILYSDHKMFYLPLRKILFNFKKIYFNYQYFN